MTGVTLFSGIGGVEFGLRHLARFVGAVEFDKDIAAWHRVCHPDTEVICADVAAVDYTRWAGVDYLHASPSCKNASVANADAGEADEDKVAALAVCRALREIRPRFFTLENVRGYAKFEAFSLILTVLSEQGYRYDWGVYDAADFGVPQNRVRLLLRAWRGGGMPPEVRPTHAKATREAVGQGQLFEVAPTLLPWNGWYLAVEDLLPTCPESALAPWQIKRLPKEITETLAIGWQKGAGGGVDTRTVGSQRATRTADGARRMTALLVEGDAAGDRVPARSAGTEPSITLKASGGKHVHRVILVTGGAVADSKPSRSDGLEPSIAITSSHGGSSHRAILIQSNQGTRGEPHIVLEENPAQTVLASYVTKLLLPKVVGGARVVALTPRCLARFQTLPDSCPLPEKKSLATTMIGNAVPSLLARAVFGPMLGGVK